MRASHPHVASTSAFRPIPGSLRRLPECRRPRGCGKLLVSLLCAWLLSGAFPVVTPAGAADRPEYFDALSDTKATQRHWRTARDYERQMRYELARQHYLLALASCRSSRTQEQLRRELEGIDLQIRTMR
jgi:hypothetical protein